MMCIFERVLKNVAELQVLLHPNQRRRSGVAD